MAGTTPELGGFQIKGSRINEKCLVLSDKHGQTTRYRVTPEIIFQLAAHLPRFANQLANRLGMTDPSLTESLHTKADVVEATELTVCIDDSGTELVLSIRDAMGMRCSWCFGSETAANLGNVLISKATEMRTIERPEN